MSKPVTSFDPTNLLLGLAWLGELDRQQIRRLWFPEKSLSTVEKALAGLRREKLITVRAWSLRDEQRQITVPQPGRWSLTSTGHARVKAHAQYPARPAENRRAGLIAHDARAIEVIVRLIELARPAGLSGVFVARELRLNSKLPRPVCDALVVLQLGAFDRPDLVPWSGDPAIADEQRVRYAVEADNATEPLAVIQAKAEAYRKLSEDGRWREWWRQRYGPLPIPLWAAPTDERAEAIFEQWKRAWPHGEWYAASDGSLADNRLLYWKAGADKLVPLVFCNQHQQPTAASTSLAAPAPQPPPGTTQPTVGAPSARLPVVPATPGQEAAATTSPAGPAPVRAAQRPLPPPPTEADYLAAARFYPVQPSWVESISSELWLSLVTLWGVLLRLLEAIRVAWRALVAALRWYIELNEFDRRTFHQRCFAVITLVPLLAFSAYWQLTGWPTWITQPYAFLTSLAAAEDEPVPTTIVLRPSPTPEPPPCPRVRVEATQVNFRAEPGREKLVLRKLLLGEVLTPINCAGQDVEGFIWLQVRAEDGQAGWVATEYLAEVE
jgi:hypothetical protein